ncbi:MAG: ATP-binding cassette domain-containing protein [Chitinophagaceae bacterium]|nr:ATP-binding cassette domain-containing protein [Chitinophagaceae bacterium]
MHPLLAIESLSVDFNTANGRTHALKDISFTISRKEVVALVGESGSGKSVTSLSILRLLATPPARYCSGKILFHRMERNP